MQAALDAALAQPFAHDPYIVVLGDLGATRGILQNGKLAEWYTAKWKQTAGGEAPAHLCFRDRRRCESSPRAVCWRATTACSNRCAPPSRSSSS